MTYPKDTAAYLFYFMRNTNGFVVGALNNQTVHLVKQNGVVTSIPQTQHYEVSGVTGLYYIAASSTDLNYEGQLSLLAKEGTSFQGQAVYYVSDPLKQIKAALSGTGTLPTVSLTTLSIYNSAGVGLTIGGLFPVAINASIGANPAVSISAPQSPVLTINQSTSGITQSYPSCTI